MAAYDKDAFVTGDEYENLQEFEDNLNDLEAPEDEEDDDEYFCLCGRANDNEMIMCEADECIACIWYHYECAGFPAGVEPDENLVWICSACKESGEPRKDAQPVISTTSTQPDDATNLSQGKPTQKKTKGKKHTPKSVYKEEDAVRGGHDHLNKALNAAINNPINKLSSIGKFIIYLAQAVLLLPTTELGQLVQQASSRLYSCAGEKATVTPSDREKMWSRFHLFVTDDLAFPSIVTQWNKLFESVYIQRNRVAENIFIQNITKSWFTFLLKDRNDRDFPNVDEHAEIDAITPKEQAVIRYVAGFIAFKLKRFYCKFPANVTAQHIIAIIHDWRITKGGDVTNFLKYTTTWIDLVDRGGLYHVNDSVFCFFRQLEEKSRPYINTCYINQNHSVNLKAHLQTVLLNSMPIRTAWNNITRDFEERELLLRKVIDIFINIRIKAYVKAVSYQNRQRLSKKKAKALRAELTEK